jgi:hypothetical protein
MVEAVVANRSIGWALADRYRADVHKAGYGDGYYGFTIRCNTGEGANGIRVFCRSPRVELPGAKTIGNAFPSAAVRSGSYILQIDSRLADSPISGWAIDWSTPELRRPIHLIVDGKFRTWHHATLFRSEFVDPRSDGFHGFSFSSLAKGCIELRDAASGFALRVPTS